MEGISNFEVRAEFHSKGRDPEGDASRIIKKGSNKGRIKGGGKLSVANFSEWNRWKVRRDFNGRRGAGLQIR